MRRVLPSSWSSSVIALLVLITTSAHAVEFPGPDPGPATATRVGEAYVGLANHAIRATWSASGGRLVPATLRDELSGTDLEPARELFVLEFQDGTRLAASRMHANPCTIEDVAPDTGAVIAADRIAGKRLRAVLVSSDGALRVRWSATLRDGASYVRQEIAIEPVTRDADVARIVMVDHWLTGGDVVGRVSGSPIVAGSLFTGLEHPMATSQVEDGGTPRLVPAPGSDDGPLAPDAPTAQTVTPTARWGRAHVRSWLELSLPLPRGRSFVLSSVTGTAPPGQMRRAFLCYVERERAHPYRTFLHYNSWYDIGYFTRYDQKDALGAIERYGEELARKRGVTLDSFLFDDG